MSGLDEAQRLEGDISVNVISVDTAPQVPQNSDDRTMRPSIFGGAGSMYPMRAADAANPGGWLAGGWLSMAKVVRDYDEEKVKDCKEDIDTLLVFAGLYSAVLSAFIVESYKLLLQDPKDEMLFYMRHLVAKNYLIAPGFMNATDPSPQPPPFTPPTWAIRVNVLWFASLVLSLSAASFGILVKQWLREFLAMEYTLPQERLRARQYRGEALKAWGVYEIAAALPLLLQIALGLFFIGLCYFTEAVHQSIGHTTLPLVSGWAFFIFLTTIAPLISPRCPYKTTFLKHITKSLRRRVFSVIKLCSLAVHVLLASAVLLFIRNFVSAVIKWTSFDRIMAEMIEMMKTKGLRHWSRRLQLSALSAKLSIPYTTLWPQIPDEEEDVLAKDVDDTGILLDVDVIMPTNGFLPMILETYRQQGTLEQEPDKTIVFVLSLIKHRVTPRSQVSYNAKDVLPSTVDLRSLSKLDWNALSDVVTETLDAITMDSQHTSQFPIWVQNAIILLLSPSKYSLGERHTRTIQRYLSAGILSSILGPLLKKYRSDSTASISRLIELLKLCTGKHTDDNLLTCTKMLRELSRDPRETDDSNEVLDSPPSLHHLPLPAQALVIDATIIILRERPNILSATKSSDSGLWVLNALYLLFSDTASSLSPPSTACGIFAYNSQDAHDNFSSLLSIALGCKEADLPSTPTIPPGRVLSSVSCVLHYYGMRKSSTDLDLKPLNEKSWSLLSELLGKALAAIKASKKLDSEQLTAAHDAIAILLSRSKFDLHPEARLALLQWFSQPGFLGRLHDYYSFSGLFKNSGNTLWYARRILGLYYESESLGQRKRRGAAARPSQQLGRVWLTWSGYAVKALDQWDSSNGSTITVQQGTDAAFLLLENFQLPLSTQGQSSLQAWTTFAPSYIPEHILDTISLTVPSMHRHLIRALHGLTWWLVGREAAGTYPSFFDLSTLPDNIQTKIIHASGRVLIQHCKPSASVKPSAWPWIEDGMVILFSKVAHHLPTVASYAFSTLCQCLDNAPGLSQQLARRFALDSFPPISPDLLDLLTDSPHGVAVLRYAVAMCHQPATMASASPSWHRPILQILRDRAANGLGEEEYEVLHDLWKILSPTLDSFVFHLGKDITDFELWSPRMLVVLSLASNRNILPENTELYDTILSHHQTASLIPFLCATIHWQDGWYGHQEAFIDAFGRCDIAAQTSIVQGICKHLERSLESTTDWDAVKLFLVCIQLFQAHLASTETSRGIVDTGGFQWTTLWKLLAQYGRRYSDRDGWRTPYRRKWWHDGDEHLSPDEIWALDHMIARDECLARIKEIRTPDDPPFPFDFWNVLYLFVPVRSPFVDRDDDD